MSDNDKINYISGNKLEILTIDFGILKQIVKTFKNNPADVEKWWNDLMISKDYDLIILVKAILNAINNGYYQD